MQPVVDGLEDEYNDQIEFQRLDANSQDGRGAFQAYGLRGHPSYVVIDPEGAVLWLSLGEQSGASMSAEIEALDSFVDEDIVAAIESLPENFRLPVLYADVEGFSYKEIAEILDVPIGTVMSRLHRGRKALQRKLWNVAVDRGIVEPES